MYNTDVPRVPLLCINLSPNLELINEIGSHLPRGNPLRRQRSVCRSFEGCLRFNRQTVANCTCFEREAKVVASPPVIEYMAVQMRTGQPPINMMLNSGMDVGVFGDQIAALSERTNRICFGR